MRRWALVTVLFTLGCGGAQAAPVGTSSSASSSAPPPSQGASSGGEVMSRGEFLSELRPLTTALFCTPESYFRQCFAITEPDCLTVAGMAFDACVAELGDEIPATIQGPEEGEAAGQMMGACTGAAYDQALAERGLRHDTAACNDPSNWAG